jgi:uncharacterized membrane protein YeaQ/YmgE (transglycosylase-associated protein family)
MPSFGQFIVWVVIGLIGGGIVSRVITWDSIGFGRWANLALGLAGAIVGGLLFRFLSIWPELDNYSVSLRDIVAAVTGSFIVLLVIWLWRNHQTTAANQPGGDRSNG